jgi:hypothetical protein
MPCVGDAAARRGLRVRDRVGDTSERIRFLSAILPPYCGKPAGLGRWRKRISVPSNSWAAP